MPAWCAVLDPTHRHGSGPIARAEWSQLMTATNAPTESSTTTEPETEGVSA